MERRKDQVLPSGFESAKLTIVTLRGSTMVQEHGASGLDFGAARMAPALAPSVITTLQNAEATFRTDLAGLLETHAGAWVVYHGGIRLGTFATKPEAFRACAAHGLVDDECLIEVVEPLTAEERLGPGASGLSAPSSMV